MKIALCLSGQPRNAIQTSQRVKETIINGNDVDVFLHCWYDSTNLDFGKRTPGHWGRSSEIDIDKKLLDVYNPKGFCFEKPKHWENSNIKVTEENIRRCFDYGLNDPNGIEFFEKYTVDRCHSQCYSKMMVNFLRENYSIENNIKYDVVITMRYDVSPSIKLDFSNFEFDSNILYHQNLNQPLDMISDWFGMGSPKIMNVWSTLYYHFEPVYHQVMSKENIWCVELLLRDHLKNNKIKTKSIDLGVSF